MTDQTQTWMIDGKPGAILGAMIAASKDAATLGKKADEKKTMTFVSITDIRRASRVLTDHDITTQWTTSDEFTEGTYAQVRVTARFIATSDGSYLEHSVRGGANGGMGRALTIATTAAIKQIFTLALQLVTDDADEKIDAQEAQRNVDEWSADLREVIAQIDACETLAEIKSLGKLEASKRLTQQERLIARTWSIQRRKDIQVMDGLERIGDQPRARGR